MKIKTAAFIIIIGFIVAITFQFIAIADDNPHNQNNYVSCWSCHLSVEFFDPAWSDLYDETCLNACHNASSGPYSEVYAPKVKTHSSANTSTQFGSWTKQCRHCHDPHYQAQRYSVSIPADALATGTIASCVDKEDNTATFVYSGSITYRAGWNAGRLTDKTGKGMPNKRSAILFPDVTNLEINYAITAVDTPANTITVKVNSANFVCPSSADFAVLYGQSIRDYIYDATGGTDRTVKFFDQTGVNSFADGDTTYNGVCEVCHTRTEHYRNDGSASEQNHENISGGRASGGANCIRCHKHADGFAHGYDCETCHGHDDGWNEGPYAGTTTSHSTHTENESDDFRGPLPSGTCTDCHNTSRYPDFKSGIDSNGDGKYYLSETNVCDTCHSPDGGFNGVVSTGGSIGAKDNWETGVYQADGTLIPGKVKWCAGCHDNAPSEVDGKTAPDIAGDNTTYGYYWNARGAHGNATYGVSRQGVSYAQGECLHCHDVSVAKILPTRIINESFEKNPGYDESGWTEPAGNPDEDSILPACTPPTCTPPLGVGSRCLKSISTSPGYQAYATRDYGSEQTKTFTRFYLYVEAEGLDDGDVKPLGALQNSTGANVVVFGLNQNAGQLRFLIRLYYNNGSSYYDDYFDISTNRWYRIEFEYDNISFFTFYSEWKVDGVSQGSGTLSVTHYSGIQKWNFGFWSALAETGTIYFDKVAVDNNDWVGEETDMLLHGGRLFDASAEFCFKCHDNTTSYATNAIVNRSYSYRSGGWTSDPLDDILEAFSFTSPGSFHNLSDIKTFITDPLRSSWGYTSSSNPCASCHNPHSVQGDPANSPNDTKSPSTRGWPVSRPSEHSTNYNNVWGDDATERISGATTFYWAPKRVGGGYEPDGSSTQDGSNMPNYVFLCLDCHNTTNVIWSTRLNRNLRKISWGATDTGDFHGVKARNDGGSFACGGECGDLLEPYKVGGSYPKTNYILNCTDCHEPHGSPNEFLLRPTLNGYQANVVHGGPFPNVATCMSYPVSGCFYEWCKACHTTHYDPEFAATGPTTACFPCHHHCDPEGETCGMNFF